MSNSHDFTRAIGQRNPVRVVSATVPNGYVAGNRFTIAHGLEDIVGNAVTPDGAYAVATATDADGAITAYQYQVVKMDATNVTLRTDAPATSTFDLFVF